MMIRTSARSALVLALASSLGGCAEERNPSGPGREATRLDLEEETIRLRPGGEARLTLRADGSVRFHARKSDVVTVSGTGQLRAVGAGITWVVAQAGALADSALVVVSLTDSPASGIAFVLGSDRETQQLTGVSRIYEPMGGGRRWTQVTASVNPGNPDDLRLDDLFNNDLEQMLLLQLDSVQQQGFRTITPWTVQDGGLGELRLVGREGAMVWVRDPVNSARVHIYVPVEPIALEIDRSDRPAAAGPATGLLVGRLSFEAAGLIVQIEETGMRIVGQVSTETTTVYAEFSVAQRVEPLGGMRATVSGGPRPVPSSGFGHPQVAIVNGGLFVEGGGVSSNGVGMHLQAWIGTPSVGDNAIGPVTVEELAAHTTLTAGRGYLWSEAENVDALQSGSAFAALALSAQGTLRITRLELPGSDTYGTLEATATVNQALIYGGAPNATQVMTLEIIAPIVPTGRDVFVWPEPAILTNTDLIPTGPGIGRVSNGDRKIVGRVSELADGIADVAVTLLYDGGSKVVRSDEQGNFQFTGVNIGQYDVRFEVPAGYQLAYNQPASYVNYSIFSEYETFFLHIRLADAAGNGALRVIAGSSGTGTAVDGVEVRVSAEGSSNVLATLVTGGPMIGSGMAVGALQPGRYDLEYVLPAGYRFTAGQASTARVEVRKGLETVVTVGVVRQ